jgi:hypothetical protein
LINLGLSEKSPEYLRFDSKKLFSN